MNDSHQACSPFGIMSVTAAMILLLALPLHGQEPSTAALTCQFLGETLVPRIVMGVRRVDADTNIDVLQLRRTPGQAAPDDPEAPLFRPFFVVKTQGDSAGNTWYLLQDSYSSRVPRGWATEQDLHQLQSRYAYTFRDQGSEEPTELMASPKDSYEQLQQRLNGGGDGVADKVLVRQRTGVGDWEPVTVQDTVPFVEILVPLTDRDSEYPDTTPSFRFGIPLENRLIHMAAICGGPRDDKMLRQLKDTVLIDKGLEMLFVVDETASMQPFNAVVANFINNVGRLAEGQPAPVRIAVCSYTDGPPGQRVSIDQFTTVTRPEDVTQLAERVAKLGNDLPPGNFANPPERMLEGLRDALRGVAFDPNGLPFVAVVGDTGHEPEDPEKKRLVKEIATLIQEKRVRTYFMHVGPRATPFERLFEGDFEDVQQEAIRLGVPKESVVYQTAQANTLQDVLESSRKEVEDERRRLRRQIATIEVRTPYTEPGPKLLEQMAARGIDRRTYEARHLQFLVPSCGWLFQPGSREASSSVMQFRQLVLIAGPERQAIIALLADLRDRLTGLTPFDGDEVIARFARELGRASGDSRLEARALAAWERLPPEQRSVGLFLEDVVGLRLKSAIVYRAQQSARRVQPATEAEGERVHERLSHTISVLQGAGEDAFWFEAASVLP